MYNIPYGRQFIDDDDISEVCRVLRSPFLTTGPAIGFFEEELCRRTGAKYALAVSSGTAALHLASMTLINKGDRVITTPNSFVATSNSILYAGGIPFFSDIGEDGNIDLEKVIDILRKDKTIKALYVVNFSGNPVDYEKLKYIRENFDIKILEDSAHALGAISGNFRVGSCKYSDCSIFSFHPVKHITTGEGGAITTNDEKVYEKLIRLRSHGILREDFQNTDMAYDKDGNLNPWYYEMTDLGFNYRITDFQAALGISQLKKLDIFIKRRKEIAKVYDNFFERSGYISPLYKYNENSSYHLYVVKIDFKKLKISKGKFFHLMRERGIFLQLHYIPINLHPYYRGLGYGEEELPLMYDYYEKAVSLPIFYDLTDEMQNYVCESMRRILEDLQ
ncbi:MAG: UDP-4-amino-4,6-dideoxy-N-acetyl-beta-L-altrosamine transaminase [Calditerrivibrio sp.]|nr:UDP-4-amino-4,6-dideoxy-N-acetyl-beta-L-altrosamine transaminase [Calditerrivibrio sp.]MCA1981145.1 UDP-4-amino-4,6-dideoxy-N-acetyl-beta-L-altrosamine transaminase [Calditerrivibrio sp.]